MPETSDIVEFVDNVVEDLVKHISDDGKIDGFEITQTVIENAPGAVKASMGSAKVIAEYQSAPQEDQEKMFKYLASTVMGIASAFAAKK